MATIVYVSISEASTHEVHQSAWHQHTISPCILITDDQLDDGVLPWVKAWQAQKAVDTAVKMVREQHSEGNYAVAGRRRLAVTIAVGGDSGGAALGRTAAISRGDINPE